MTALKDKHTNNSFSLVNGCWSADLTPPRSKIHVDADQFKDPKTNSKILKHTRSQ